MVISGTESYWLGPEIFENYFVKRLRRFGGQEVMMLMDYYLIAVT